MVEYTGWDDYVKLKSSDVVKNIFEVGQAAFQTYPPHMTPMDYRMYQDIEKRIKALEDALANIRSI